MLILPVRHHLHSKVRFSALSVNSFKVIISFNLTYMISAFCFLDDNSLFTITVYVLEEHLPLINILLQKLNFCKLEIS